MQGCGKTIFIELEVVVDVYDLFLCYIGTLYTFFYYFFFIYTAHFNNDKIKDMNHVS